MKRPNNHGFTLIEVLVSMAIIGLIVGLSAMGLRSVFNVNLRSSAGKLASSLRYLSQKAVTDHLYLRVVYDFGERRYSVEESRESFLVPLDDLKPDASKSASLFQKKPEKNSDAEKPTKEPEGMVVSEIVKPTPLPSGVFFKDISVFYRPEKVEEGKAYTYFFPDGYATPTMVHLRNEDDDEHFSIEVSALSGQVKVYADYQEAGDLTKEGGEVP